MAPEAAASSNTRRRLTRASAASEFFGKFQQQVMKHIAGDHAAVSADIEPEIEMSW
jgi:hypothetical protein